MGRQPDDPSHETFQTLTIHDALLRLARDLAGSGGAMESQGDQASLSDSRARYATAIFLASSALEAFANVIAGLHYDGPRGKTDARDAGWPRAGKKDWHRKSTPEKWKDIAKLTPKSHLEAVFSALLHDAARQGPVIPLPHNSTWQQELARLCSYRHEIIAHFKGR
jgi:hypothetical protein